MNIAIFAGNGIWSAGGTGELSRPRIALANRGVYL
jgi:hypothetical protein